MTDPNGAFEVPRLAAADYTINASPAGDYLGIEYGAGAPGRSGKFLIVGEQAQFDITLKGWRAASIAGRVLDERGRPITGASVRVFASDPSLYGSAMTDDRGAYEIRRLRPGEYAVGVAVALSSRTIGASPAGAPTARAGGIFPFAIDRKRRTVLLSNGAPLPPSTADGRTQVYTTAFFGGATTQAGARRIAVGSGETRADVDITLPAVRGVRVAGIVSAPIVKGVILSLAPRDQRPENNATRIDATAAADGTFVFVAVPPGDYTLTAFRRDPPLTDVTLSSGAPAVAWDDVIGRDKEGMWAELPLSVGDADIEDLGVQLSPGILLSGTLVYDVATPPQQRTRLSLAVSQDPAFLTDRGVEMRSDGTVSARLRPGHYRILAPHYGTGPSFRTAVVNGVEIGDGPLVVGSEPLRDVQFVFASADTALRGTIADSRGKVVGRGSVMIFPADHALWFRLNESHRARVVPFTDGAFAAAGLPPGDYYVVAVEDARAWLSVATAERAIPHAAKVTLRAGEPVTVNLRVEPRE